VRGIAPVWCSVPPWPTPSPRRPERRRHRPRRGARELHLTAAQVAVREGWAGDADAHLTEARDLATRTGERNAYRLHFGPANVAAWSLAIAVELGRGPSVAAGIDQSPATFAALDLADRRAGFHLDLSRAYAQAGDEGGIAALEHIVAADRAAPTRIRSDPIRSPGIWCSRWTGEPGAGCESWTAAQPVRHQAGGSPRVNNEPHGTRQHRAGDPMVVRVAGGPLARPTHGEAHAGETVSGHHRAVAVSR